MTNISTYMYAVDIITPAMLRRVLGPTPQKITRVATKTDMGGNKWL